MGKKAKGPKHLSRTTQYKVYEIQARWKINRIRKLKKYVKNNPNDLLAKKRLKDGIFTYRRKTPLSWNKMWRPAQITFAQNLAKGGTNGMQALREVYFTRIY